MSDTIKKVCCITNSHRLLLHIRVVLAVGPEHQMYIQLSPKNSYKTGGVRKVGHWII